MRNVKNRRVWIRDLVLLAATLILVACDGIGMSSEKMLERAKGYLAEADVAAAAIELRNAVQADPENAEARYLLGEIILDYGDFASAEKEFRQASKAGWKQQDLVLELTQAQLGQHHYDEVLEEAQPSESWPATLRANLLGLRAVAVAGLGDLEKARAIAAEAAALDADALYVLKFSIQLELLNQQLAAAQQALETALARYPDDPGLLLLAASASLQGDDMAATKKIFQRVIDMDPSGFISANGRSARLGLVQLLLLEGDLQQAESNIKPLYVRNPNDPFTNYLGGVLEFSKGDYGRAEEHLLKVLKLAPEHNPTRLLFGTVSFALENYEQAAYFLSKYLLAVPDNVFARKLLGRSYLLLGEYDTAKAVLKAAVTETADDGELLALAGLSELRGGDRASGIAGLERAVAVDPDSLALREELASAYITTGESALAIKELQTILEQGGQQKKAETLLVIATLHAGEFEEAINLVLKMLSRDPEDPATIAFTGNVFAASGDRKEARKYFERALANKPGFPPAIMALASIEELDGNTARAIALYRGLVNTADKPVVPMLALARLSEKQGNKQEVVGWLERAIENAPDEVNPRVFLASYYLRENQLEKAGPLVAEAAQLAPQDPEVLGVRGRLLVAERRYQEALSLLTELVESIPDSVTARLLLAECQVRLGHSKEARMEIDAVLQQDANNMVAVALLAQLEIREGELDQALEHSQRIQQEYPELYLGYQLEGDARTARQDHDAAGKAYTEAWARRRSSELATKRAENSTLTGNPDAAAAQLQAWLSDNPDDVRARQVLGVTYQQLGQEDKAVQAYEKVLSADSDNTVALNNLAWLYMQSNNPEAVVLAERAYNASPESPSVADTYGWILVQQDQADKGLRLLEQARDKLSDVAEVRYHYAVALYKTGAREAAQQLLEQLLSDGKPFEGEADARIILKELQ